MDLDITTALTLFGALTSVSIGVLYRKLKVLLDLAGDLDDMIEDDTITVAELVDFYEKVRNVKWKFNES